MKAALILPIIFCSCGRVDVYYPSDGKSIVVDDRGRINRAHGRAVVLNGTDSLGHTQIDVTRNGVHLASAGGLDSSTTTLGWQRTIRHGVTTAGLAAVGIVGLQEASAAYSANQAQTSASNVAASNAAASQTATKASTAVQLSKIQAGSALKAAEAAKALPAAGSVIPAQIPATVVPVP